MLQSIRKSFEDFKHLKHGREQRLQQALEMLQRAVGWGLQFFP